MENGSKAREREGRRKRQGEPTTTLRTFSFSFWLHLVLAFLRFFCNLPRSLLFWVLFILIKKIFFSPNFFSFLPVSAVSSSLFHMFSLFTFSFSIFYFLKKIKMWAKSMRISFFKSIFFLIF